MLVLPISASGRGWAILFGLEEGVLLLDEEFFEMRSG